MTIARIKVIQLTDEQRLQLEEGYHQGKSHAYRKRHALDEAASP